MPELIFQKEWQIPSPNPHLQGVLSNALNIHPLIAQLLINRQIKTVEEARHFFSDDISSLHDPFLLKDMDKTIERIKQTELIAIG